MDIVEVKIEITSNGFLVYIIRSDVYEDVGLRFSFESFESMVEWLKCHLHDNSQDVNMAKLRDL